MGRKRTSIKNNPNRQGECALPLGGFALSDKDLAQNYISELQQTDFVTRNKIYLSNYINSDVGIAMAHIKQAYEQYVCKGKWAEDKFHTVMTEIVGNRELLIPRVFMRYGIDFDNGKIKKRLSPKEEQEKRDKLAAFLASKK